MNALAVRTSIARGPEFVRAMRKDSLTRNSVYLGEIAAGLGLILPTLLTAHLAVFALFLGAQLLRTHYEEGVLRRVYPEYAAYARRTRRLIPFIL